MSITDYLRKISTDVVTHHSVERPRVTGELTDVRQGAVYHVPATLCFQLGDGTVLNAPTLKEISLGRRSRATDPVVTIDFQEHGGFQHGVSRYHAMIVVVKGALYLRDLNSVNGTFLNGQKLAPITSHALKNGDTLTLGDLSMTIEFR